jgi:hypothetical protein
VRILRASAPGKVLYTAAGSIFKVETSAGAVYEIERATAPAGANNVEPIAALPASTPKKLGSRTIGLAR